MPYKDKEKQAEFLNKFIENKYVAVTNVRFPRSQEELYIAAKLAAEHESVSIAEYMRIAAREKLQRDGYLPKDS